MSAGMKRAAQTASTTKKVTISLRLADLEAMTAIAAARHGGNLSGAFAAVIAQAARLDAMDQQLELLPPPSKRGIARLDAELTAPLAPPRTKRLGRKSAAVRVLGI